MPEYALITLNVIEYAGIYLKKQSAEYARIFNVSEKLSRQRRIKNTVKHLKLSVLQKE